MGPWLASMQSPQRMEAPPENPATLGLDLSDIAVPKRLSDCNAFKSAKEVMSEMKVSDRSRYCSLLACLSALTFAARPSGSRFVTRVLDMFSDTSSNKSAAGAMSRSTRQCYGWRPDELRNELCRCISSGRYLHRPASLGSTTS